MEILNKLRNLFTTDKSSNNVMSSDMFFRSISTLANIQDINADSILQNPTAFACIDTLGKTIAQQPFIVTTNGEVQPNAYPQGLLDRPNQFNSSYETTYQIVIDLMTHGNAFIEVRRSGNGTIRSWRVIPPRMIRVQRDVNGNTVLTLDERGAQVFRYRIDNVIIDNVFMIRDITSSQVPRGLSRVSLVRRLIALDNAIDTFGNNLFNRSLQIGSHALVIPETLKPDQVDEIYTRLKEQYSGVNADNAGETPILEGGIEIKPIPAIKPTDADMTALKRRTSAQICGVYGVPASLIELDNGTANYNNLQQRYAGFYRDTVGPHSINITQKMDRIFGLPPGTYISLDASELLKGDMTAQTANAVSLFRNGIWTRNEARDYTGLQPVEDGDDFIEDTMMPNTLPNGGAPSNTTGNGGNDEEN